MPIDITEEELRLLQQTNPQLAQKISLQIVEEAKQSLNSSKEEKRERYAKGTSAPYYTERTAKQCCLVLDALVADKTHDIIIPSNMLRRTKSSAQQYYTQGFNYVVDNPKDFPQEYQAVIPFIRIRQHDQGLWFHWVKTKPVELTQEGFIKIPLSEDDDKRKTAPPDELPIFNWRTQLMEWLVVAKPGEKKEFSPLALTEEDQEEAKEMILPYNNKVVSVVNDNKIIVRYLTL